MKHLDEIRKVMFTRVIGQTNRADYTGDYTGELIGYDSSKRNSYVIRVDGGNTLVECYDIVPIPVESIYRSNNNKDRVLDVSTTLLSGMLSNPSYNLNDQTLIKNSVSLSIELIKYIDSNVI